MSAFRWLLKNLSTLLLSFVLAVTVWASAVVTADPNQDGSFGPVDIEVVGQAADLLLTNEIPAQAVVTIKAPRSIWDQINNDPDLVRAWIDMTGLAAGEHAAPVLAQIDTNPVRILDVEPPEIRVVLEPLISKNIPVQIEIKGEPPLGYRKGTPEITPSESTITGPASAVERVVTVSGSMDIIGASQNVRTLVTLRALDENGASVPEVVLAPKEANVFQPISILGGYKNVAVKVFTIGQVAPGYRLSNISVTPPTVTVYSADPQSVNELPGFVETLPVDLADLTDDAEFNTALKLPEGITLVSEPSVLVQIGVAAIEGSLTLAIPVEPLGLPPTLSALISPHTVDVIVTGPLPVLDTLTSASFRAVVDLANLSEGVYQIIPTLDLVPEEIEIQAILPEAVEVIIAPAPTATPTSPGGQQPPIITVTPPPTPLP